MIDDQWPGTHSLWNPNADGPECEECDTQEIDDESVKLLDDDDRSWRDRLLCAECREDAGDE